MSELRIYTNHHRRLLEYWCDLTPEEQADYDWLHNPDDCGFFHYKGNVYCLEDFISLHNTFYTSQACRDSFPGWDGYSSDSFFSGVLIRWPVDDDVYGHDTDRVIVGWYCS